MIDKKNIQLIVDESATGRIRVFKRTVAIEGYGEHEPAVNVYEGTVFLELEEVEPLIEKLRHMKTVLSK